MDNSILALISDLYSQIIDLQNTIKQLQQENAELKERLNGGVKSRRNDPTRDAPIEEYQSKK